MQNNAKQKSSRMKNNTKLKLKLKLNEEQQKKEIKSNEVYIFLLKFDTKMLFKIFGQRILKKIPTIFKMNFRT